MYRMEEELPGSEHEYELVRVLDEIADRLHLIQWLLVGLLFVGTLLILLIR